MTVETILPWVLSVITLLMTYLAGNRDQRAWTVGLIGQALWLVWIWLSQNWGFLPLTLTLTAIYWRNHQRWR